MTSFHLLPPYHQPLCIRRLAGRIVEATYLQNATLRPVTAADDKPKGLDWPGILGGIIIAVGGFLAVASVGSIFYIAIEVPRQQGKILDNQAEMRQTLQNITTRMAELERNDRRQDVEIIKQQHR